MSAIGCSYCNSDKIIKLVPFPFTQIESHIYYYIKCITCCVSKVCCFECYKKSAIQFDDDKVLAFVCHQCIIDNRDDKIQSYIQ